VAVNDLLDNFLNGNLVDTFNSKWRNIEVLKEKQNELKLY
jgi:hypothetical protein